MSKDVSKKARRPSSGHDEPRKRDPLQSKQHEDAAARQRARDRASDDAPPRGVGRTKGSGKG